METTEKETENHKVGPDTNHAVVNIPDEKKGEQLILFTTHEQATRADILADFKAKGLSELAVPKTIQIVAEIPLMGTGKTDYVKLKEAALQIK